MRRARAWARARPAALGGRRSAASRWRLARGGGPGARRRHLRAQQGRSGRGRRPAGARPRPRRRPRARYGCDVSAATGDGRRRRWRQTSGGAGVAGLAGAEFPAVTRARHRCACEEAASICAGAGRPGARRRSWRPKTCASPRAPGAVTGRIEPRTCWTGVRELLHRQVSVSRETSAPVVHARSMFGYLHPGSVWRRNYRMWGVTISPHWGETGGEATRGGRATAARRKPPSAASRATSAHRGATCARGNERIRAGRRLRSGEQGRPAAARVLCDGARPRCAGGVFRRIRSRLEHLGCHRHRRRPRRLRGGGGGGARGRAHPAADPQARDHRRDVLQSGDRRPGQGPSGARDRRARRADGPAGRRGRHPVPAAEPLQGPGGARPARPDRPQALSPGHAGGAVRPAEPGRSAPTRSRT